MRPAAALLLLLLLAQTLAPACGLLGPASVGAVAAAVCAAGTSCPPLLCPAGAAPAPAANGTSCLLCAPGTFAAALGSAACAPCPAGTAAPAFGSAACAPCPAGFSASGGGAAACAPCAPGTAAPLPGAHACSPCAPGSVPGPAAASCALCPLDTWSNSAGRGAAASACVPCPAGQLTAFAGSSSPAACLSPDDPLLAAQRFACALPTQARTSSNLTSPCAPLTCPAQWGLVLSADGSACVGCPAGRFGSLAQGGAAGCAPIPAGSSGALYLPFTQPAPLFDFWPGRAAGRDPVLPPPGPPGAGGPPRCVFLNDTASNAAPSAKKRSSSVRAISAALAGGIIVLALLALFVVLARFPLSAPSRWCHFTANLCPPCDQVPPAGTLDNVFARLCGGAAGRHATPRQRAAAYRAAMVPRNACERQCERWSPDLEENDEVPTGKGVVCTLMLVALLAMYCAYQIVLWQDNNLNEVDGVVPWDASLPFLSATGGPPASPASSTVGGVPGVPGVTLRFFVDGDAARCSAPLGVYDRGAGDAPVPTGPADISALLAAGAGAQGWVAAPPATCGSAAKSVSVFTLYCPNCVFSSQSGVTLALDASCQSVFMEVAAVRAYPRNTVGFMRAAVAAASPDAVLSSATWSVNLLLHGVLDYFTDPPGTPVPVFRGGGNQTGYIPLTAELHTTLQPTSAVTARPSEAAPLLITVHLPLESYVFVTTLTQLTPLLDNLTLLTGTFPSVFGSVLIGTVLVRMLLSVCIRPPGGRRRVEEGEEGEEGEEEGEAGAGGKGASASGEGKHGSASGSAGAHEAALAAAQWRSPAGAAFSTANPMLAGGEAGGAPASSRALAFAHPAAAPGDEAARSTPSAARSAAAPAPAPPARARYHHAAGEAELAPRVRHFAHADIPATPLALARTAAAFGCSEAAVRAAARALQDDELPEAWGYDFAPDPATGEAVIFAPDGRVEDPRDDFLHYLHVWLAHERWRGASEAGAAAGTR